MNIDVRTCRSIDELRDALNVISHYFARENSLEDAERFAQWLELERMHAAFDGDRIVGGTGAFTLRTVGARWRVRRRRRHRRRRSAVASASRRAHVADARAARRTAACGASRSRYLWASEATIYGRFGYGLASRSGSMTLAKERARSRSRSRREARVRLVDLEEAARVFPPLYEHVFSRSGPGCSRVRRGGGRRGGCTTTPPAGRRRTEEPGAARARRRARGLRALHGEAGLVAAARRKGAITIMEAVAPTPEATRELWRWLLDFDWTSEFVADLLPLDHPLFLLLAEPRRMRFRVSDGVWVRLVDVGAALAARSFGAGDDDRARGNRRVHARERRPLACRREWRQPDGRSCRALARRHRSRVRVSRRLFVRRPRPRFARCRAHSGRGGARRWPVPDSS